MYLLVLVGQSDTIVKLVDQETWDWIHVDPGFTDGVTYETLDVTPEMEKRILAYFKVDTLEDFSVTIGSWENDKALFAPPVIIDDVEMEFGNMAAAFNTLKDKGIDILGSYQGHVY